MSKGRQREETSSSSASAAMREVWRLYEAGDTVSARRGAKALLAGGPSSADAEQARELLARTRIPGLAWGVVGIVLFCAAVLIWIALTRV